MEEIVDRKKVLMVAKDEVKKIAFEIYKDMKNFSVLAIDEFYMAYRPKAYKRLWLMPRIFVTPSIKQTEDGYIMRFVYTEERLSGGHPAPHDYWVFTGPFEQGYHGGPVKTMWGNEPAPQSFPSPWNRISQYAEMKYNAKISSS